MSLLKSVVIKSGIKAMNKHKYNNGKSLYQIMNDFFDICFKICKNENMEATFNLSIKTFELTCTFPILLFHNKL